MAVDQGAAAIRFQHGVEDAQRGGLAGAVRPDQPGDLAIARGEADAAHGLHVAERLPQILDDDQASTCSASVRNGRARSTAASPSVISSSARSNSISPIWP